MVVIIQVFSCLYKYFWKKKQRKEENIEGKKNMSLLLQISASLGISGSILKGDNT